MNHDLSLFKNFKFSEQRSLQFRFMGYNFLNHAIPSFLGGDPGLNLTFNSAGQVSNPLFGTVTKKREPRLFRRAVSFSFCPPQKGPGIWGGGRENSLPPLFFFWG